jgi:hypothetical protein
MNAIIQGLNANIGILSFFLTLGVAYIASRSLVKSRVESTTNQAQNDAIQAMQGEIASLRRKTDDLTRDKIKLEQTIDTICSALRIRGMIITIQGELIHIEDRNGKTTTTRIKNEENGT